MIHRPSRVGAAAAAAALVATTSACGSDTPAGAQAAPGTVEVVAAFYPLQYAVQQVGGSRVSVVNLTKPGAEPHDVELTPQDVAKVSTATLAVYEKGFQPAVDQAIADEASQGAFDVSAAADLSLDAQAEAGADHAGHDHADDHDHAAEAGATDPHFWLDPTRYAKVARAVATRLGEVDPAHKDEYERNAQAFSARLTTLDKEFTAGLKQCTSRDLVTSHAAFGYLAARYDLHQIPISGLSPEAEPEPARLAQVAQVVKKNKVRTIYSETLVDPAVARTVASETGAASAVLDPIEGLTDASAARDYEGIMRANLATLRRGQGCS